MSKVLGLTGSIGMGKSTTAAMFADLGIAVFDADVEVYRLYAEGGKAVRPLCEVFGGDILGDGGGIDRQTLRDMVLGDVEKMAKLEAIVHPLTAQAQVEFRTTHAADPLVVLDIPLLYEVGSAAYCDYVAVVTAPYDVQKARVLLRDGMTEEVFKSILVKQMPDAEKRAQADFVISTAFGLEFARAHVELIVNVLRDE